jgi:hypothetical protein
MNPRLLKLILLISCLVFSCTSQTRKEYLSELVKERIGESVIFPSSIVKAGTDSSLVAISQTVEYEYKLVVYTDGDCGKCISELYEWSKFLNDNREVFKSVREIFIIYSVNFPRFEYTTEKVGIKLPFYYDSTNIYITRNTIDEPLLQTLILDKNNKILIVGNPLKNAAMQKLYRNVLSE